MRNPAYSALTFPCQKIHNNRHGPPVLLNQGPMLCPVRPLDMPGSLRKTISGTAKVILCMLSKNR